MMRGFFILALVALIGWLAAVASAQTATEIEITGLDGLLLEQATANITVANQLTAATSHRALDRRLRQASDQIDNALKANGYYSAVITHQVEEESGQRKILFAVDKGQPVIIDSVQIEITGDGADFDPFLDWRSTFPLQPGDILVDKLYQSAITELQRTARKYGFFDSSVNKREIRVNRSTQKADILITFETGPRYRYSDIRLDKEYFDEGFLQRFFNIEPDQFFNNDDLQILHQRYAASGYFSSIRISPVLDEREEEKIPVSIELQNRKRDRYFAGLGFSTDLGLRGKLGIERRYANNRGHGFDILLDYSELKRLALFNYEIPLSRPYAESLHFTYQYNDRRDEDLKSLVNGLDVSRVWKYGLNDWQYGLWLFSVKNELDGQFSDGSFLAPTAGWSHARADNPLFPRRAWQLAINLIGASQSIVSSESFLQAQLKANLILPVFEQDRLLLRSRLGRTLIGDFSVLPKQLRFYAGGDNSVRGYKFQSLAPHNESGSLTGGDSLIFTSVEYEHYFQPMIGAAVFWDAGNAFFDGDPIQLVHGAGVGLHLNLPFGVFRIDVANALSKPGRPWRLHVTLRPDL
ncbi:MAG: autotransporter assembly complex family protein [Gammaproteobacteria bacterium]|nr:MAG: autotransporter assembly complex family protein [Gammaproteobacteria bacterium]